MSKSPSAPQPAGPTEIAGYSLLMPDLQVLRQTGYRRAFPWAISLVVHRCSLFLAEDPQQGPDHPAEKLREFDGVKFHPYPSLPDVVDPTVTRSLIYMRNPPMCAWNMAGG